MQRDMLYYKLQKPLRKNQRKKKLFLNWLIFSMGKKSESQLKKIHSLVPVWILFLDVEKIKFVVNIYVMS